MAGCAVIPAPDAYASSVIRFLDCQARSVAGDGFAALAAPGSSASLVLHALLTILIAVIGYRLLFGGSLTARDGVFTLARIAIVLALATSWPAYQTTIFSPSIDGPAELAGDIGRASALPGNDGTLVARIDLADAQLRRLTRAGVGIATPGDDYATGAPPLWDSFDAFALGSARVVFLGSAVMIVAIGRLGTAFFLASGPLFAGFLLFEMTFGLFLGWLKSLLALALGTAATAIALSIELALLEPWLAELAARRAAELSILGAPAALLTTVLVFAVSFFALFLLTGATAFLWMPAWRPRVSSPQVANSQQSINDNIPVSYRTNAPALGRERALVLRDAVNSTLQREERLMVPNTGAGGYLIGSQSTLAGVPGARLDIVSSDTRRVRSRISASARQRDGAR